MAQTRTSTKRTEVALGAAQEAVRASIEATQKIADCSMEAGSEAAQRVQQSLKDALHALRSDGAAKPATPSRRSA
jgi:hypothetical protein